MKVLYITVPDEKVCEELQKVCSDIAEMDETFKFVFVLPSKRFKMKVFKILRVQCPDTDIAHRRGFWFLYKTGLKNYLPKKAYYWVK